MAAAIRCKHCSQTLAPGTCLRCRRENRPEAKFCGHCGKEELVRAAAPRPAAREAGVSSPAGSTASPPVAPPPSAPLPRAESPADERWQPFLWLSLRRLKSDDLDTRHQAFAKAVRDRNLKALLLVVEDPDQYVRDEAIKALGEVGDAGAVPALIKRLDDSNFNNQEYAAEALAKIADRRAVRPLVAMLRDAGKHRQARNAAVKALVALADPGAVPPLIEALRDPDDFTRAIALQTLGALGDARCVPDAVAALRDRDSNVVFSAVDALGALRDARAVEPLLAVLKRAEPGIFREAVVEALGRIGDGRAGEALAALLGEGGAWARKKLCQALDALGWRPADDALAARYLLASERFDDVARLGWERVRGPLEGALRSGEGEMRRQAVSALGLVGDPAALDLLTLALDDEDEAVAGGAAAVIGKAGGARAVKPLMAYCLRYRPVGGHRNDPTAAAGEFSRAEGWVAPLEELVKRAAADLSPEDLRALAALEDRRFSFRIDYDTPGYGDGADDYAVTLDFSRVRELAAKESRRRSG